MCMVIIAALIKAGSTGSVAHLGERLHGMEEVEGSIPFRSTRITRYHIGGNIEIRSYSTGNASKTQKGDNPSFVSIVPIHVAIRKHLSHRDYSLACWGKRLNVKPSSYMEDFFFSSISINSSSSFDKCQLRNGLEKNFCGTLSILTTHR